MMIEVACIVDFPAQMAVPTVNRCLMALAGCSVLPRIELSSDRRLAEAVESAWHSPVWVTGGPERLARWCRESRPRALFATIDVEANSHVAHRELAEALFDAGVAPLVRAVTTGATELCHRLAASSPAIFAIAGVNDQAWLGDLRVVRLDARGALVGGAHTSPIWELDRSELTAALGTTDAVMFHPPIPVGVSFVDGSKLRRFGGGGAMAMYRAADELRFASAFGFASIAELQAWTSDVFPLETWEIPGPGEVRQEERDRLGRSEFVVLPEVSVLSALELGCALASRNTLQAEALLGLRVQSTRHPLSPDCAFVDAERFRSATKLRARIAPSAAFLLARTLALIAAAPNAAAEVWRTAAMALAFVPSAETKSVVDSLERSRRAAYELASGKFRGGAASRARRTAMATPEDTIVALKRCLVELAKKLERPTREVGR